MAEAATAMLNVKRTTGDPMFTEEVDVQGHRISSGARWKWLQLLVQGAPVDLDEQPTQPSASGAQGCSRRVVLITQRPRLRLP